MTATESRVVPKALAHGARMCLVALVVCVGAGPGAGVAHAEEAQYGETRGAASILLGLEYARTEAPTAADDLTNTVSLQTRLRGVLGRRIGPLFGAGFALGGGLGGGFAYGFELDLVGLGWRFSRGGFAGVVAGGGFSGVTGHIRSSLEGRSCAFGATCSYAGGPVCACRNDVIVCDAL